VFGVVYTVLVFGFIVRLMYFRGDGSGLAGVFLMLYLVMVTKFGDMGAYAIGSLIGRHKMIPHISPGKSWEGFGGQFWIRGRGDHAAVFIPSHATLAARLVSRFGAGADHRFRGGHR